MPKAFSELRERLLRAGVAPRHVQRYLVELADHFVDLRGEEERAGRSRAEAEAAALVRIGATNDLVNAMTQQRHYQAWCVRAPWAAFGLAPLFTLVGAWFVASVLHLSAMNEPFHGYPVYRMRAAALLFLCAPILIGWGMAFIAAHQRFRTIWPTLGLIVNAWMGSTFHVTFTGFGLSTIGGGLRFAGVRFLWRPDIHGIPGDLIVAPAMLLLTALPYVLWRVRRVFSPHTL